MITSLSRRWPDHRGKRSIFQALRIPGKLHGEATFVTRDRITIHSENLADIMDRELFMYGSYQSEVMAVFEWWLRPGELAVDVGANNGYTAIAMAKQVGSAGRVLAFEPLPERVRMMEENVRLNDVASIVDIHALGLGDRNRTAPFMVMNDNSWNSRFIAAGTRSEGTVSTLEVEMKRLDDVLAEVAPPSKPSLVKMDAEGYEPLIFAGAKKLREEDRPGWLIEYNPELSQEAGCDALASIRDFIDLGYGIYRFRRRWWGPPRKTDLVGVDDVSTIEPLANILLAEPRSLEARLGFTPR